MALIKGTLMRLGGSSSRKISHGPLTPGSTLQRTDPVKLNPAHRLFISMFVVVTAGSQPAVEARPIVYPPDTVARRLLIRIPTIIKAKIIAAISDNQPQYCVGCRRIRMK